MDCVLGTLRVEATPLSCSEPVRSLITYRQEPSGLVKDLSTRQGLRIGSSWTPRRRAIGVVRSNKESDTHFGRIRHRSNLVTGPMDVHANRNCLVPNHHGDRPPPGGVGKHTSVGDTTQSPSKEGHRGSRPTMPNLNHYLYTFPCTIL